MRRLVLAAFCLAAGSLAVGGEAVARDYSGKYKSKITPAGGEPAKATVTITKISDNIYQSETKYKESKETAICLGEEDRLSCGFALKSDQFAYIGVNIYRPRDDGKLVGEWVENITKTPGKEILTPVIE